MMIALCSGECYHYIPFYDGRLTNYCNPHPFILYNKMEVLFPYDEKSNFFKFQKL